MRGAVGGTQSSARSRSGTHSRGRHEQSFRPGAGRLMSLKAAETPFASMQQVPASWRLLDDSELMELPDPEFTIDGILARRSRTVIYGPPGSCKTTLAAGLMVSVTTGRKWFGHEVCHCGPCCYV